MAAKLVTVSSFTAFLSLMPRIYPWYEQLTVLKKHIERYLTE